MLPFLARLFTVVEPRVTWNVLANSRLETEGRKRIQMQASQVNCS
ncbi:hypothetical protein AAZX31_10G142100 [Glycine max]